MRIHYNTNLKTLVYDVESFRCSIHNKKIKSNIKDLTQKQIIADHETFDYSNSDTIIDSNFNVIDFFTMNTPLLRIKILDTGYIDFQFESLHLSNKKYGLLFFDKSNTMLNKIKKLQEKLGI